MDKETKALLVLGLLNEAFGDVRSMIYYIRDFVESYRDWKKELEEFGVFEVLENAERLEKIIIEKMDLLKRLEKPRI
ncbi:MAG: hypothetical protein NZ895_00810 [Archaeoglobaceae archaeon]|nr:hypothetical protein [Archaeoglobaceae archaeon]MCX8151960.1 hypothetical protein [Archaeoglobaceae archaeon]MDW8013349.1 hypothetical protein [Archaeoglobaceae archaeon]